MRTLLVAVLFAIPMIATAQTAPQPNLEAAKAAFWKTDFKAAADGYRVAAEAYPNNPDVWFNLGTSEAHAERFGPALHALEQALRLDPEHADAAHNLAQVRTQVIRNSLASGATGRLILPGEDDLGTGLLTAVLPRTLSIVFTISWVLLFICLWWARRTGASGQRTGLVFAAVIMSLVSVGAGGLLWGRMNVVDENTYGVVVADKVEAHQGPGDQYPAVVKVLSGVKVRISGADREWAQVVLPDGSGAWLPGGAVRKLH